MENTQPWYSEFQRNVTSQYGEDGILERIFHLIGIANSWCVEFGAADGKFCSNTYNLIQGKDFSAVLVEADRDRYDILMKTFEGNPRITALNCFVGFEASDGLDSILKKTPAPINLDLLSIDVDGNDYHIWDSVQAYRPRVVIIEYNPTIPSQLEFVQARDMSAMHGSSLRSVVNLGKSKGYELVAATLTNAIFVDAPLFPLLGIKDNSIASLRQDESKVTYLFSGYDGSIFVRGHCRLSWHDFKVKESKMQILPKFLRRYPDNYNRFQRLVARVYRALNRRGIL